MQWHRSLYWRIAAGFVACLALLLIVQALLFVWVVARSSQTVPNQPPERFAQTIAVDVSQALARDPPLDVAQYVRQEYARDAQPFFVLLRDGRTIEVGGPFPDALVRDGRARLENLLQNRREFPSPDGPFARGAPSPFGGFGRGEPPAAGRGVGRGGRVGPRPAIVRAGADIVALVIVPPRPPFSFLLARYAPALAVVAVATLLAGAALAAFVVFGPARKRLRAVEDAARRLGAGDLAARAPESGRDEVAAVAAAFNAMADDLAARADALAAADRARRQLLADVSHELTTPVTAMRGYLDTLTMPELGLDDATRTRYLGIVSDETSRLERIIGDLLELARLEGGGQALRFEAVPLDQLFDRVVARHERAAAEGRVEFRRELEAGATQVAGDRDRLEQALQNVAANALRYAPSGSTITLGAHREDGTIVVSVTDQGSGIPPEHLPHVFDRFFKADASRAVRSGGGGSGLGLSIVKAIVERHGGSVAVDSRPGRTVFSLRLKPPPSG